MAAPDLEKAEAPTADKNIDKKDSSFVVDREFEQSVAGMIPQTDDPSSPALTWRVWLLGIFFCFVLTILNQLFYYRTNSFVITSYLAILLSYPIGVFLAKVVPAKEISLGPLGSFNTNPGPFSIKEHVLIGIWGSTGAAGVYGTDNLLVQRAFYNLDIGPAASILFLIGTSVLGFGISGVCRKFLIKPAHMVWPSILPQVALYGAFHITQENKSGKKHLSSLQVFFIGACAMFVYHLIGPGWISPMLSQLPLLCWIAPNGTMSQYYGSTSAGVGIFSLTLDWSYITSSAMSVPYWSAVNLFVSYVFFQWLLVPLSFGNDWFSPVLGLVLNDSHMTNKDGKPIGAAQLVGDNHKIMLDVYEANKPLYITPYFAWSYFGSMAQFTASISHTVTFFGADIVKSFKASRQGHEEDDIHNQLMKAYPEVPDSWYYGCVISNVSPSFVTAIMTIVVCHVSGIGMAWWATLLSMAVSIIGTIPIAIVLASTGNGTPRLIAEFVYGLILPGDPVVMMAFKCLGVTVSSQCLTLLSDLKTGHYLKVPPRAIFTVQIVSQLLAVFICYYTQVFWFNNPEHIEWLKVNGKGIEGDGHNWGATNTNIYYSASLIWGAIGPIRFFFESVYSGLIIGGLIVGLVLPPLLKAGSYLTDKIPWHLVQAPILFQVGSPGAYQSAVLTSFLVSTFFQFFMYRYHRGWWTRYNYVLATALDVGVAIAVLLVNAALTSVELPNWLLNPDEDTLGPLLDTCHPPEDQSRWQLSFEDS
ncbi:OPT family small oligopeptide transporter [Allomyces macrogynus ATCC 38327]|uniref:OPT family small oligopeptide transporter n=1 Tax=Allomyces macrogynus (strain ATCC 38327) TaxID=578462 RepID=A0A0L0SF94_ALLM3|nr:OPT family small oligopeptide transporter, variant [Allomyces macrogynus ATCC 38327]KNE61035.1 OPT family small oligopeptide transporter [Allomyces macrogynus ATCC 38327]|eukprot:KNE61034.1 OPT family small oligopeptide transporter, variant [Allomyces macrogynus ATCC 38327]